MGGSSPPRRGGRPSNRDAPRLQPSPRPRPAVRAPCDVGHIRQPIVRLSSAGRTFMAHHRLDLEITTTRRRKAYFLSMLGVILLSTPRLASGQTSDTMPPSLVSLDFNPKAVDVRVSPQAVAVTAHVTDDLSGTSGVYAQLMSPSSTQYTPFAFLSPTSCTPLDRIYER